MGRPFKVFTDHKSLKHLLQQRLTTLDQHYWLTKLMGFQFEIIYKPGAENKAADALSRIPDSKELNVVLSSPYWLDLDLISKEIQGDPNLTSLISSLEINPSSYPDYIWHGGVTLL